MTIAWICIAAFCASYGLTEWLLQFSRRRGLLDLPNARSSHATPTPRGGGLSIVIVTACGILIFLAKGYSSPPLATSLLIGGLSVAAIGYWDDHRPSPVSVRFAVHLAASVLAVYCLPIPIATHIGGTGLGMLATALGVIAIAWVLNLFNFMDGIDGIAASEAACILFSAATLGICLGHVSVADISPALLAGAACLGFLKWNWARASIFMGDVGSGFLGYIIAVIALDSARSTPINLYAWLILGGTFLVDATLTLYRRTLRGERIFEPHRTHAYQWQTRRWGSHSKVTLANIGINIFWLLPWAAAAVKFPSYGVWICIVALIPLGMLALFAGAGRAENTSSQPS